MIKKNFIFPDSMRDLEDTVSSRYLRSRSYFEPLIAGLLLIPALPAIGLLVVITRLTSRGPGIFRQSRVGKDGEVFTMYKIRTMRVDAEAGLGSVWSQRDDPRVTKLGRWIRRLHLDELPQLLNVVKREMSLIGPRPERPDIVVVLNEKIDGYCVRHLIKPGITGLAQINLPPDSDLDSVRAKLCLDLVYLRTANRWLDLRIFLASGFRLIGLSGDGCIRLFRLDQRVPARRPQVDARETAIDAQDATVEEFDGPGFVPVDQLLAEVSHNGSADPQRYVDTCEESPINVYHHFAEGDMTKYDYHEKVASTSPSNGSSVRRMNQGRTADAKKTDSDMHYETTRRSPAPRPK